MNDNRIKLTESELINIIKKVLNEQSVIGAPNYGVSIPKQTPVKPLVKKFTCTTNELSAAAQYAISHGINPFYVRYAMGILGRESDFGKIMGKYGLKAAPEYYMNKMSETIPGFKGLLQWGAKKVFNKNNWVPSMGVAQMTPDIAKKI